MWPDVLMGFKNLQALDGRSTSFVLPTAVPRCFPLPPLHNPDIVSSDNTRRCRKNGPNDRLRNTVRVARVHVHLPHLSRHARQA